MLWQERHLYHNSCEPYTAKHEVPTFPTWESALRIFFPPRGPLFERRFPLLFGNLGPGRREGQPAVLRERIEAVIRRFLAGQHDGDRKRRVADLDGLANLH